jgi:hypothetical protein
MPDRILDSAGATTGGITTLAMGAGIQIYEMITMENINNLLEFALIIGGGLFMWYRIRLVKSQKEGVDLDNERKRKEL